MSSDSSSREPVFLTPDQALVVLGILHKYYDRQSKNTQEKLLPVCEDLREIAENAEGYDAE